MESRQLAISTELVPPSEKDWDDWKSFIHEEYLVKNRGIKDVFESLRQLNSQATYTQFRAKLNEWRFRKNLTPQDWRYIDQSITERKSQQKQSVVIYSGMRLDQDKVMRQLNRNRGITPSYKYGLSCVPELPKADTLYICTPRAASPTIKGCPESLPWLQFSQSALPDLLRGLRILPESETEIPVTMSSTHYSQPRKKRRSNASSAWDAFEKLVRRSMEIVIGSEELTKTLLSSRSVDRIAGYLDELVPTTYGSENLTRAILLLDGEPREVQREILKILLFLVSNHLIMNIHICGPAQYVADARAFVDICRYSGFTEPHVLARIVKISLHNPTMAAVIDLLYEAAVNTEAINLVSTLLEVDANINPNRSVGRTWWLGTTSLQWSALQFAILRDSLELAKCMLQHGANANDNKIFPPIVVAAVVCPNEESSHYIPLLLQYGAVLNEEYSSSALLIAISRNHFKLIHQLHEAAADFTLTYSAWEFYYMAHDEFLNHVLPNFCEAYVDCVKLLDDITTLGLAVSFRKKRDHVQDIYSEDAILKREDISYEEAALELVKFVIDLAGPLFDLDGKLKSDALIHAASHGYTNVISFLYESGAQINSKNGYLCPVYAAVNWCHVQTCQKLLSLGGSTRTERRKRRELDDLPVQLSPLHIAAGRGSCGIVRILVQGGVDVNLISEIYPHDQEGYQFPYPLEFPTYGSALNVATLSRSWETALLLLDIGATSTSDDLTRAAYWGETQLVTRLLDQLPNPEVKIVEYQLQILLRKGEERRALKLLDLDLPINREKALDLALKHKNTKISTKLIKSGAKLTIPRLIWAFQILDESTLRAHADSLGLNPEAERSQKNGSFLENAILSNNLDIIRFALSLEPLAYDSGALCAVILGMTQSGMGDDILQEIIRRRELENQQGSLFDPVLENTAISIAAYHGRLDIILLLQRYSRCEINAAVLPNLNSRGKNCWSWPEIFYTLRLRIKLKTMVPLENLSDTSNHLSWSNWHDPNRRLISPLLFAIKSRSEAVMQTFLGMKYRPDAYSLQAALFEKVPFDLASRLIEQCIDINASQAIGMAHRFTPVYLAATLGQLDLMKRMLANGANLNAVLPHIRSVIIGVLIEYGKFDAVNILFENGIDIKNIPGPSEPCRHTALAVAARIGHLGILRRLLECHVDPDAMRIGENSAIVAAASHGRLDAVQLLLHHGAGKGGRGQVHYIIAVDRAMQSGHSAVVQFLKSHQTWTDENEKIRHNLKSYATDTNTAIIDYDKDTEEDVDEFLAFAETSRMVVVETGSGVGCRVIGSAKEARQEINARRQEQLNVDSGVVASGGRARNDNMAKQVAAMIDSGAEVFGGQNEPGSLDEANLSNRDLDDVGGMLDTEMWYRDAGNESENIQFGPHGMAEEDKMKYQSLLKDILGEEEMPFEPVEQPW